MRYIIDLRPKRCGQRAAAWALLYVWLKRDLAHYLSNRIDGDPIHVSIPGRDKIKRFRSLNRNGKPFLERPSFRAVCAGCRGELCYSKDGERNFILLVCDC